MRRRKCKTAGRRYNGSSDDGADGSRQDGSRQDGGRKTEAAKTDDAKAGDSAKTGGGQFKAALIVTGSVNDAGWNAAAYNGMKAIESEMGAEINFSENVSLPDAEPALRDFPTRDTT